VLKNPSLPSSHETAGVTAAFSDLISSMIQSIFFVVIVRDRKFRNSSAFLGIFLPAVARQHHLF
jgi:hypothetical protein